MRKLFLLGLLLLIVVCSFFVAGYYVMFDYSLEHSYTRAICSGNSCVDYEFTCLGNTLVHSKPISSMIVFSSDWIDSRDNKNVC
jgi:flagellar biosynthesis protein FlhB